MEDHVENPSVSAPEAPGSLMLKQKRTLLTEEDVTPSLQGRLISLFWPEPGPLNGWWTARVEKLNPKTFQAKLYYDHGSDDAEIEETDLMEIVRSGHVSYYEPGLISRNGPPPEKKPRAKPAPRKPKAVPAPAPRKAPTSRPAPTPVDDEDDDDDEDEDEDEEEDSSEEEALVGPRKRKASSKLRAADSNDEEDDVPARKAPRPMPQPRAPQPPGPSRAQIAAEGAAQRAAEAAAAEKAHRDKAVQMMREALEVGASELAAEAAAGGGGEGHPPPPPAEAAQRCAEAAEGAMYAAFGGLSKEYKTKLRSLMFNLKDAANPELRQRVLLGELPAERLASASPVELASPRLSEWRDAKAKQALTAVILTGDVDKLGRQKMTQAVTGEAVGAGVEDPKAAAEAAAAAAAEAELPHAPPPITIQGGASPEGPPLTTPRGGLDSASPHADAPFESFEAFASRAAQQPGLAETPPEAGVAKRTRIDMSGSVKLVSVPSAAPPPPPAAPAAPPAPRPAPAPAAPAAPKPARVTVARPAAGPDWEGTVHSNTPACTVALVASPCGGEQAPLGGGFLPAQLSVKGRIAIPEVDKFLLGQIQKGKSSSRTLTLALARLPAAAGDEERSALAGLCEAFDRNARAGLCAAGGGAEVYLLPPSALATRVLASEGLPPLPQGTLLMAIVHKRGLGRHTPKRLPVSDEADDAGAPGETSPAAAPPPPQPAPPAPPAHQPPPISFAPAPPPDIKDGLQALADMLMGQAKNSAGGLSALAGSVAQSGPRPPPGAPPLMHFMPPQGGYAPQRPPSPGDLPEWRPPPAGGGYAPPPGPRPPPGPPPGMHMGGPPPQQQQQQQQQQQPWMNPPPMGYPPQQPQGMYGQPPPQQVPFMQQPQGPRPPPGLPPPWMQGPQPPPGFPPGMGGPQPPPGLPPGMGGPRPPPGPPPGQQMQPRFDPRRGGQQ